jgi:peptidoglycan hydrolase-like protein with peptidoglycan-binding domain
MTPRLPRTAALALSLAAAGCRRPEAPDSAAAKGVPPKGARPRVPASPEALLAPGAVGRLQRALAERGLLGEHRAGELDDATSAAVRRFQEREGLAATGFPDRETLAKLGISPEDAYGR